MIKTTIKCLSLLVLGVCISVVSGCASGAGRGNSGHLQAYPLAASEADWIRNGEPIEFEGEPWYPSDGIESLLDAEVLILGEYRGVQFFVDKIDVRPYSRLYTKFGRNKFRYFEKKKMK